MGVKRWLRWGWVALWVLLPGLAQGEEAAHEADHEALRTLLREATAAVNRLDARALEGVMAPGFVAILADQTPITDGAGLDAYFDRYFRAPDAPLTGLTLQPEAAIPTHFVTDQVGVVYGSSHDNYRLRGGGEVDLLSTWSATVVKMDGQWRVQSFHAGVDMTDNPLLDAARYAGYGWGGGGLLLGGGLVALLFCRRRAG